MNPNKNLFPKKYFSFILSITLILTYFFKIKSQSVINIDNTNKDITYSTFLKNSNLGFLFYQQQFLYNLTENLGNSGIGYNVHGSFMKKGESAKVTLTQKNYFSILDSFYFQNDGKNMTYLKDYYLDFFVDDSVIPFDKFKIAYESGKVTNNPQPSISTSKIPENIIAKVFDINCIYVNNGINYNTNIINNFNYVKVQNLMHLNIGLTKEKKLVRLIYSLGNYATYELKEEINSVYSSKNYTLISNKIFDDFWITNQVYESGSFILGIREFVLDIYNITEIYTNGNYKIKFFASFDFAKIFQYNPNNFKDININSPPIITNFGTYNEDVIISTLDRGLIYLKKNKTTNIWDSLIFNRTNFDNSNIVLRITDININKNTIYVIIENLGVKIFDLKKLEFIDFEFKHPYLKKFDTVFPNNSKTPLFGILVDNTSYEVNEFFIELKINNFNEFKPQINRIFITGFKNSNNLNLDPSTSKNFNLISFTDQINQGYIYDKVNERIIITTRGIPNFIDTYNYKIDLKKAYLKLKGVNNTFFDFNMDTEIFFLSQSLNNFSPGIVIRYSNSTSIIINNFKFSNVTFSCKFDTDGIYQMNFVYKTACNDKKDKFDDYNSCPILITVPISVQGGFNGFIWIIMIIVLFILGGLVIFIICCYKRCEKNPNREVVKYDHQDNDMNKNHENNIIEVQVLDG